MVHVNSGNYSERSQSVCLFWLNKEMITQQYLSDNRTHQRAIINWTTFLSYRHVWQTSQGIVVEEDEDMDL